MMEHRTADAQARSSGADSSSPAFSVYTSRGFEGFLGAERAALAVSTYQAGLVLVFGTDPGTGRLWILSRQIERPMGIAVDGQRLAVAGLTRIDTFVDARAATGEAGEPVFVPRIAHYTADLDVHDVAFDGEGRIVFVNTLFGCLATTSETYSFKPLWRPPFVSRLAAEDRCHLNGLAMKDGAPAFVTAVATTDVADGWREHRRAGGVVVDVASGETVAAGLSMPHSPRWHAGRLWVLNAGSGEVGVVDVASGAFTPVAFCPGFLRGLAFLGRYAIVAASAPRENRTFGDLPLEVRLKREGVSPRCGLFVVDTESGDVVQWLRLEGVVTELFDVAVVPGARQPNIIGFRSDEIRRVVSFPPGSDTAALSTN